MMITRILVRYVGGGGGGGGRITLVECMLITRMTLNFNAIWWNSESDQITDTDFV